MAAKVKYPIKAAQARFIPIYNHLTNMAGFLLDAGHLELAEETLKINGNLREFERKIKALRDKQ